jgi:hypothetical protein
MVDRSFDRYLAVSRVADASSDPVADLKRVWDSHVAFARDHPAVYRLMHSPALVKVPGATREALELLREVLVRCAAVGRLRVEPDSAAQRIMSANIGVALNVVAQPDLYADPELSARVRDAICDSVLMPVAGGAVSEVATTTGSVALQLAALLCAGGTYLGTEEDQLLLKWLEELARC